MSLLFLRTRVILPLLILSAVSAIADDVQPNGAVKGLLPLVTEFQFASRLEGKTLTQICQALRLDGQKSLQSGNPIEGGAASGMKVTQGTFDGITNWRIAGLEREIAPIRMHIHKLARDFRQGNLSRKQEIALDEWIRRFDAADAGCKAEPSIAMLEDLANVLLLEVNQVFLPIDDANVKLLEAILEASTMNHRLYEIESYFARAIKLLRAKPAEQVLLTIDGIELHPSVVLSNTKGEKAVTGLERRYGSVIRAIRDKLQDVSHDQTLLKNRAILKYTLLKDLHFLQADLDNGELETIRRAREVVNRVFELIYQEESLAPVALRLAADLYTDRQATIFSELAMQMKTDRKAMAEYVIDGTRLKVDLSQTGLQITFLERSSSVSQQIDSVLQLAQQTRRQSQMAEAERLILTNAIESLESSKESIGRSVRYATWAEWTNAVNEIISLYNF